ncbi:protein of unknown function [Ralstonia solanacearum CFBP2957]|nr:protein of unknown function [Ralstonia solanacearum CFBP2957]
MIIEYDEVEERVVHFDPLERPRCVPSRFGEAPFGARLAHSQSSSVSIKRRRLASDSLNR